MTKLEMLAEQLKYLAEKINETDAQQSSDDSECGVIEGKLSAYKEMARLTIDMASKAV